MTGGSPVRSSGGAAPTRAPGAIAEVAVASWSTGGRELSGAVGSPRGGAAAVIGKTLKLPPGRPRSAARDNHWPTTTAADETAVPRPPGVRSRHRGTRGRGRNDHLVALGQA